MQSSKYSTLCGSCPINNTKAMKGTVCAGSYSKLKCYNSRLRTLTSKRNLQNIYHNTATTTIILKPLYNGGEGGHWLVRMEWRPAGWLVSTSVNLPLHHKIQKFSSGTSSPGDPGKRAVKWLWWYTGQPALPATAS